jgi:hypothetical protein
MIKLKCKLSRLYLLQFLIKYEFVKSEFFIDLHDIDLFKSISL